MIRQGNGTQERYTVRTCLCHAPGGEALDGRDAGAADQRAPAPAPSACARDRVREGCGVPRRHQHPGCRRPASRGARRPWWTQPECQAPWRRAPRCRAPPGASSSHKRSASATRRAGSGMWPSRWTRAASPSSARRRSIAARQRSFPCEDPVQRRQRLAEQRRGAQQRRVVLVSDERRDVGGDPGFGGQAEPRHGRRAGVAERGSSRAIPEGTTVTRSGAMPSATSTSATAPRDGDDPVGAPQNPAPTEAESPRGASRPGAAREAGRPPRRA